ncbi:MULTISPECIES: bifunctional riboflavin kinase/FAD synthetase [unclassified Rummeliibacillus]|uniref:bifunctional riboflavin kinase/FAD synthetase n=1 Tax=unclassified Rummeliibacillus TaxID=2622809 RepID=UPI000E6630F4|nr:MULTISPECIES: bifunctional riboflavin kinase/FAD synthetase [unclassified Rummeliibacillus]RIJ69292.1 bifunctional riboflavin kinase/FAD synthetase [Rummeliibacillus sp. POC4]RPJ97025.1 bifunctional riboflavin kinase/FAD synthetase [Rummeliibacillus sp. TYF005]
MKVIQLMYPYQISSDKIEGPYSLAIGFFDGVHRGHQAVIKQAKKQAEQKNLKLAVMTFDPHPSIVLGQRKEQVFYITPLKQKLEILEELEVDTVFVVRFTSDFAKLSPQQFVDIFIRNLTIKHVTAGFDFTFGAMGRGTMKDLHEMSNGDYEVSIVEKQQQDSDKISSTRIRHALKEGDMELVRELLGRPYQIPGIVVHGDKRGRQIGFPTANVQEAEGTFIPAIGVYAVRLQVQNEWHDGVCNVGYKPTFKNPDEKNLTIEVFINNFDKNIYGEEVKVDWYKYLRGEKKFDGIDSLKAQIELDKESAMEYLSHC